MLAKTTSKKYNFASIKKGDNPLSSGPRGSAHLKGGTCLGNPSGPLFVMQSCLWLPQVERRDANGGHGEANGEAKGCQREPKGRAKGAKRRLKGGQREPRGRQNRPKNDRKSKQFFGSQKRERQPLFLAPFWLHFGSQNRRLFVFIFGLNFWSIC